LDEAGQTSSLGMSVPKKEVCGISEGRSLIKIEYRRECQQ